MTTYDPQPGVSVGRAHCAACGASFGLHGDPGATLAERTRAARAGTLACPTPSRITKLSDAEGSLRAAVAAGDRNRVFVARGEVQRLGGDPDAIEHPAELQPEPDR
jgi:hypothetical protein